jgi:hypothetical protein
VKSMDGCPQGVVLLVSILTLDHCGQDSNNILPLRVERGERELPLGVIFKNPLASITFDTVGLFSVPPVCDIHHSTIRRLVRSDKIHLQS